MLKKVINYLRRNISEVFNILEAVLRLAGSIASLTPTQKDDSVIVVIKAGFKKIKDFFSQGTV